MPARPSARKTATEGTGATRGASSRKGVATNAVTKLAKPKSVDEYLARLPKDQAAALENLRRVIRSVVPTATEAINYQIPMFRLKTMLVGFGARRGHCALYTMSNRTLSELGVDLSAYDISTGTVRFTPDTPLPASLVKKIVKARIAEQGASG
jgi:uncharacterized protein YdhG (YjbR/CyaY superfamily)